MHCIDTGIPRKRGIYFHNNDPDRHLPKYFAACKISLDCAYKLSNTL